MPSTSSNNLQLTNSPPHDKSALKRGRSNLIDRPAYKLPPKVKIQVFLDIRQRLCLVNCTTNLIYMYICVYII